MLRHSVDKPLKAPEEVPRDVEVVQCSLGGAPAGRGHDARAQAAEGDADQDARDERGRAQHARLGRVLGGHVAGGPQWLLAASCDFTVSMVASCRVAVTSRTNIF